MLTHDLRDKIAKAKIELAERSEQLVKTQAEAEEVFEFHKKKVARKNMTLSFCRKIEKFDLNDLKKQFELAQTTMEDTHSIASEIFTNSIEEMEKFRNIEKLIAQKSLLDAEAKEIDALLAYHRPVATKLMVYMQNQQ